MFDRLHSAKEWAFDHTFELAFGAGCALVAAVFIAYPEAFIEPAEEEEKTIVEVHHYHHNV